MSKLKGPIELNKIEEALHEESKEESSISEI
jgi:hypothetical protein